MGHNIVVHTTDVDTTNTLFSFFLVDAFLIPLAKTFEIPYFEQIVVRSRVI